MFLSTEQHKALFYVFLLKDIWFNNTVDWLTWNSQPTALELTPERSLANTRIFSVSTPQPSYARLQYHILCRSKQKPIKRAKLWKMVIKCISERILVCSMRPETWKQSMTLLDPSCEAVPWSTQRCCCSVLVQKWMWKHWEYWLEGYK